MNAATDFFESIRVGGAEAVWLEDRLRSELPHIIPKVQVREYYIPDICPLADIGEYIMRVLQIHTHFANHLIHGSFIHDHIESIATNLIDEDDGSTTDYLDGKHQALK